MWGGSCIIRICMTVKNRNTFPWNIDDYRLTRVTLNSGVVKWMQRFEFHSPLSKHLNKSTISTSNLSKYPFPMYSETHVIIINMFKIKYSVWSYFRWQLIMRFRKNKQFLKYIIRWNLLLNKINKTRNCSNHIIIVRSLSKI